MNVCFKMLHFGSISYAAIQNKHSFQGWEVRGSQHQAQCFPHAGDPPRAEDLCLQMGVKDMAEF